LVSRERWRQIFYEAVQSIDRLVYFEEYDNPNDAIGREKEIKKWRREKKNALVETLNPRWDDLSSQLFLDW
jgi:predicted GIY-YIG superfamily endonuclease